MKIVFSDKLPPKKKGSTRFCFFGDWFLKDDNRGPSWNEEFRGFEVDHVICNLEGCVSGRSLKKRLKAGPCLKMNESSLDFLLRGNTDMWVTLSNNHVLDYGIEGLNDTISLLKQKNINYIGAGLNEKEAWREGVFNKDGERTVVVINFSEGEDDSSARLGVGGVAGYEVGRVANLIVSNKKHNKIVVVVFHGGRERVNLPPPYIQKMLRNFAELGADLIIGHHPHVPQPWELHEGVPIFYSIGNSLFDYGSKSSLEEKGLAIIFEKNKGDSSDVVYAVPFFEKERYLEICPKGDFIYDRLKEGALYVVSQEVIMKSWAYESCRKGKVSFKINLFLLIKLLLMPFRIKKGNKGLRAFVGTPAHQEFLNTYISNQLEPTENKLSGAVINYINEK